jgi:hypothetical protein
MGLGSIEMSKVFDKSDRSNTAAHHHQANEAAVRQGLLAVF